ncbi:HEAT repeat domain-containing protein [Methanoculleus frigidifontis]|nr:HEAT repeat domain-containing protein [Methanoculleus sp. FWC-SCC1]
MYGEDAARDLIAVLRSGESDERMAAAAALARIGTPVVGEVIRALGDADPRTRMWAAYTLGLIGDPAARNALLAAAADGSDGGVVKWARAALERIDDLQSGRSCRGCCR